MAETLVKRSDYSRATKDFVERLRNKDDPVPKFIAPPIDVKGARNRHCVQNAVAYCANNPNYETAKGFKIWTLPKLGVDAYVAMVHVVTRHKVTGKYVDVTPAEDGDEGQKMLFVPSSKIYPGWSAEEITDYDEMGFEIRMGSVCNGAALLFKQSIEGDDLHKSTPEELELLFCPKVAAVQEHLGARPDQAKKLLEAMGASFHEVGGEERAIVPGNAYRCVTAGLFAQLAAAVEDPAAHVAAEMTDLALE